MEELQEQKNKGGAPLKLPNRCIIDCYVDEETKAELLRISEQREIPVSRLVRRLILDYIDKVNNKTR